MSGDERIRNGLRGRLRAAARPASAPAPAARIAECAWERAEELRRAGHADSRAMRTQSSAAGSFRLRSTRFRVPRRPALSLAAAAALLVTAVLVVRGAQPAFAVDGDSVQVLEGRRWRDARSVAPGAWVFIAPGSRTTMSRRGTVIRPRGGTVLRILADDSLRSLWRVQMRCGDADVEGSSVRVDVADAMQVTRAPESASLSLEVALGLALQSPPAPEDLTLPFSGTPSVTVRDGTACVSDPLLLQSRLLTQDQSISSVALARSMSARRLVREQPWSVDAALDLVRGLTVHAATSRSDGSLGIVLRGRAAEDLFALRVPQEQRQEVVAQINLLQAQAAVVALDVADRWTRVGTPATVVYEHGRGDRLTRISVWADGAATLDAPGASTRSFPSLASLRAAAPEAAALFGDALK